MIDTSATVSLVKRSTCIEKGIEIIPSDRVIRDVSGSEITILGSARVQIEIPGQKSGEHTRLGVCTRVSEVIVVPDGLTDSNILSLKDLEQVQIEVGRLTTFRFPGGWEHVVRSDLREITLEVGVRNATSGTRGHEAQDKDKDVCRMLTDSESGRFEWTDKYGNEWITDKVIEKWVDRRYGDREVGRLQIPRCGNCVFLL